MKKRILAAVVLIPLLLAVLYAAPKILMAIILGIFCAISTFELLYCTGLVKHIRLNIYSALVAASIPMWCYFGSVRLWADVVVLGYFVILFAEMMVPDSKVRFSHVGMCATAAIVIPYLFSGLVRIMTPSSGRYVILIPFIVSFLSDTGAYFIGCRFGKHKMAPVISPNKSIEGLFGGIVTAVVGMLIYVLIMEKGFSCQVNYGFAVFYGVFGAFAGAFGDLCFSVVKRQTGIKDYGNLIPGHGGILDRFDSMLVVGPLMELMLAFIPVVVIPW